MQYSAQRRISRKTHKRKGKVMFDYSIFEDLINKYAQVTPVDPNQSLDPNQLQVGQQIYSPQGDAAVVVENPMDTTTTTVMPADQSGVDVPQGVETLEESELAAQYTLSPNEATPAVVARFKHAQEDLNVNWNDIQDIVAEMNNAVQARNMKGVLEALEDMFDIAMNNVNMPEDIKIASIFEDYTHGR